ncbi:MAG: hypothetical protein AB7F64_01160 [Gammaproteobacteria bacterium]
MSGEGIASNCKDPEKTRRNRAMPWLFLFKWIIPIASLLSFIFYIIFGHFFTVYLIANVPWFLIWLFYIFDRYNIFPYKIFFSAFLVLACLTFGFGYKQAYDDISKTFSSELIYIKPNRIINDFVILRTFSSGMLVKAVNDKNKIIFIPWNEISQITSNYKLSNYDGVLCNWFKICPLVSDKNK